MPAESVSLVVRQTSCPSSSQSIYSPTMLCGSGYNALAENFFFNTLSDDGSAFDSGDSSIYKDRHISNDVHINEFFRNSVFSNLRVFQFNEPAGKRPRNLRRTHSSGDSEVIGADLDQEADKRSTLTRGTCTSKATQGPPMRVEKVKLPRVNEKVAFVVHNAFSEQECDFMLRLIREAPPKSEEGRSCDPAERRSLEEERLKEKLLEIVKGELPEEYKGCTLLHLSQPRVQLMEEGSRVAPGFTKSELELTSDHTGFPSGGFPAASEPEVVSFFTVKVQLTNSHKGGQLRFLKNWSESVHDVMVPLGVGSCAVYQHNLLHSVSEVTQGSSTTLVMEVLYTRGDNN